MKLWLPLALLVCAELAHAVLVVRKLQHNVSSNGVPVNIGSRISPALRAETASCGGTWKTNALTSRLTTSAEMHDPSASQYLARIKEPNTMHRKQWEYVFLLKVLDAAGGMPRKAVGFAVGTEPTVAYFASKHVHVTATDLPPSDSQAIGWTSTNQHLSNSQSMNDRGLATDAQMSEYVKSEYVNMNTLESSNVWKQRGTFDLVWSICSVEHVGSISQALVFMAKSLELLSPGGTVVHTTEFNLENLDHTLDGQGTVIFRKKDIDAFLQCAKHKGYTVADACYDPGDGPIDMVMDTPPYSHDNHLRLEIAGYVSTCVGMVVRKPMNYVDNGYSCDQIFSALNMY